VASAYIDFSGIYRELGGEGEGDNEKGHR
jgi:hypothetical protein